MLGKLKNLIQNRDGTQNLIINLECDYREEFDELKDENINIEIKKASRRKSLEANAFLWSLCGQIAIKSSKFSDDGKNDVYREAIREKGVWQEVYIREDAVETFIHNWSEHGLGWFADVIDEFYNDKGEMFKQLHVFSGSSTYDSAALSHVIDYVVHKAEDLGIPTITPKEEERMLAAWGRRYAKRYSKKEDKQILAADGTEAMLELW